MMYKIRTMYVDAEATSGPVWCQPKDSRITCCGRMLRFLHLDELPQLINIVRGEMDLIGPRPERTEFVEKLVDEIPKYAERLAVLPGVTGLAQINQGPDESTDCVRRKLIMDMKYIRTASWSLDLRIVACTALRMIGIRHGVAPRWFHLDCKVAEMDTSALKFEPAETYLPNRDTVKHKTISAPLRVVDPPHQPNGASNGHFQQNANLSLTATAVAKASRPEKSSSSAAPRNPK